MSAEGTVELGDVSFDLDQPIIDVARRRIPSKVGTVIRRRQEPQGPDRGIRCLGLPPDHALQHAAVAANHREPRRLNRQADLREPVSGRKGAQGAVAALNDEIAFLLR